MAKINPCKGCKTRECESCEHASSALKARDLEQAQREVATRGLEGDLPYDRDMYVRQVRVHMSRAMEDILAAGRMLLVLKEREGYGGFGRICEEEIGIPRATAYRWMNTALKAANYPGVNLSHMRQVGSAYALLEAPEEDLKRLENEGVMAGKTLDELDRMSVREMRALIRQLKDETDKIVKAEVRDKDAQIKSLNREVERLTEAAPPDEYSAEWMISRMENLSSYLDHAEVLIRGLVVDPRLAQDPASAARVWGMVTRLEKLVAALAEELTARMEEGVQ